jgi:hypothetical protein
LPRKKTQKEELTNAQRILSQQLRRNQSTNKQKLSDGTTGGAGRNRENAAWKTPAIATIGGLSDGYIYENDNPVMESSSILQQDQGVAGDVGTLIKKPRNKKHGKYSVLMTYSLGNRRPEGITAGTDSIVFVSELLFGGVKSVNVTSGAVDQIVPSYGYMERPAAGLWSYKDSIVVTGLGPMFGVDARLYVHSTKTGELLASCLPDIGGGLLSDVTVMDGIAYATDSRINQIVAMDMEDAIAGKCSVSTIILPSNEFYGEDDGEIFAAGRHTTLEWSVVNF